MAEQCTADSNSDRPLLDNSRLGQCVQTKILLIITRGNIPQISLPNLQKPKKYILTHFILINFEYLSASKQVKNLRTPVMEQIFFTTENCVQSENKVYGIKTYRHKLSLCFLLSYIIRIRKTTASLTDYIFY